MELMATYHKRRQTKIVALGYEIFIYIMLSLSMIQTGEFSQLSVCLSLSRYFLIHFHGSCILTLYYVFMDF